ncbi:hypothetical protein GON03_09735 [Nocardioides sp. MAH-18]|uniref:DUF916 domain-containing protein n=1 Tax=Nocardioides agri TaxID=2682843 RepID=A0A6L6XRT0_9ACTN|nr:MULTISPECIES: hypothetical protein [unclassified Nocardioides]MBA2954606.1 hypothetical protein [Nocardioides sp. CGMCC 1.13656]MVQ49463.1 hypothetical protein [Nocardioides sp. MAH-18]
MSAAGLALVAGVALPGAAAAQSAESAESVGAPAARQCPKSHITYAKAGGETTQFGWLLAPGGTRDRDVLQYNVVGGTVICDSLVLSNSSEHAISVRLYSADAYNTNDGGFAFTGFKDTPKVVGTWIQLPFRRVTVPAGRAAEIPIVVRVPMNVSPGDTAGGVVAQDTKVREGPSVADANVRVGVRAGVGVRLYAQVAGLRHPELTVTRLKLDLSGGLWSRLLGVDSGKVSYQVTNTGNVILAPEATGEVTTRTSSITLPDHLLGETLPGSTAVVADPVHGLRWGSLIGRAQVKVTVSADGAAPVTVVASGWRVPWLSLVALTLLVALAVCLLLIRRRRRQAPAEDEPTAEELEPVGV